MINNALKTYIQICVMPQYNYLDAGHRQDHIVDVINNSLDIVDELNLEVNRDMVYTIAAYHDVGLQFGRKDHHITSAKMLREDITINEIFTAAEVEIMAQAIEDHRASSNHVPRSIYGMIVSEADRNIDLKTVIKRTLAYGLNTYPTYTIDEQVNEAYRHIKAKYGEGGYMKLHMNTKRNVEALQKLRYFINDESTMKSMIRSML